MNRNLTKVGVDVDGVFLDFYRHLCNRKGIDMMMLDEWTNDEINEVFYSIIGDNEFWQTIPALNIPEIITFDFDYYITALPPEHENDRKINLRNLGFPDKPIIVSIDKVNDCIKHGIGLIIDDKISTIEECNNAGLETIHYKPNYYTHKYAEGYPSVRSMLKVGQLVKQFQARNKNTNNV
ncbi:hypothetical protein BPT24_160 [Tenacibaculum phage pT24]|uniref:Uncharacterized protein n=1 Tax=Tenacibaculum phage pT24 TaxID=1880590 RepID=A0A1B4XWU9_9CAUD|nr:hypothetical protein HYP10_gp160 [Tenacibaculum phage pT24]BAV39286.1 hypothetical protein BPT24_160 [Tenacibaculum phage pT24]